MRSFIFIILNIFCLTVSCQFDASTVWFSNQNFFDASIIAKKGVKTIQIERSIKYDDQAFSDEQIIGKYTFNRKGWLLESQKYVQLTRRVDSTIFEFNYLSNGMIQSRIESQGPFSFAYQFNFIGDSLIQETKIDLITKDTNFRHTSITRRTSEKNEQSTEYNTLNRPMRKVLTERDLFGQVVKTRESYARSLSFLEYRFIFTATQLNKKMKWNTIGKQSKTTWNYSYVEGFLDEILEKKEGVLSKKYGLLYNQNQLVKAIVVRDLENKSVSIYRIYYKFHSTR